MKVTEALALLEREFPDHSLCVTIQSWRHRQENGRSHDITTYTASVLPGWDGSKCNQATGRSVEEAVRLAISRPGGPGKRQDADDALEAAAYFQNAPLPRDCPGVALPDGVPDVTPF